MLLVVTLGGGGVTKSLAEQSVPVVSRQTGTPGGISTVTSGVYPGCVRPMMPV